MAGTSSTHFSLVPSNESPSSFTFLQICQKARKLALALVETDLAPSKSQDRYVQILDHVRASDYWPIKFVWAVTLRACVER